MLGLREDSVLLLCSYNDSNVTGTAIQYTGNACDIPVIKGLETGNWETSTTTGARDGGNLKKTAKKTSKSQKQTEK